MPCARMPSSLEMSSRMSAVLALKNREQFLELAFQRFHRLETQRGAGDGLQVARFAMLVPFLACALDRVLLGVEQMLHQQNQLDLLALINAIPGSILRRIEKPELAFPVAQHVRLEIGDLTDLADGEVFLDWFRTHVSCSARSSRDISS